jgi:H+/Cl- antiporter ClcA
VGDAVCRGLGDEHIHFHPLAVALSLPLILKLCAFALPVALVAGGFSEATHRLGRWTKGMIGNPSLRAAVGGLAVIALVGLFGTSDYLNLGTIWLPRVFDATAPVPVWAFAAKFLFTAVTLGFGFKGGEVTPLFAIGALLGSALAGPLGLPVPFLAAVGYICVFGAASNTPIACAAMGAELFGAEFLGPIVVTGFLAYVLVGHRGIYGGGRIETSKDGV